MVSKNETWIALEAMWQRYKLENRRKGLSSLINYVTDRDRVPMPLFTPFAAKYKAFKASVDIKVIQNCNVDGNEPMTLRLLLVYIKQ